MAAEREAGLPEERGRGEAGRPRGGPRRRVVGAVLALALVGGASLAYYYRYQRVHYVGTEDAKVEADLVPVTPQVPGKLTRWTAAEGDQVEEGQVLGTVDPGPGVGGVSAAGAGPTPGAPGLTSLGGDPLAQAADRASIRAPAAGVLVRTTAVPGAPVAPGQPLAYLADLRRLYVVANVEETRIALVRVGQEVDVRTDAYPGVSLQGRVRSLGLATTGTFSLLPLQSGGSFTKVVQRVPVKVELVSPPAGVRLLPGLSATVRIHVAPAAGETAGP